MEQKHCRIARCEEMANTKKYHGLDIKGVGIINIDICSDCIEKLNKTVNNWDLKDLPKDFEKITFYEKEKTQPYL
jgi:hypothetical protein